MRSRDIARHEEGAANKDERNEKRFRVLVPIGNLETARFLKPFIFFRGFISIAFVESAGLRLAE
jgi:hypothetical protein